MESLVKYSESIRLVFEQNKQNIDLPFFYSFPRNACESAACFHSMLIQAKFPNLQIEVLHGYNRDEEEHHYWLEVDSLIFDITCDQFEGIPNPIYASPKHPMSDYFTIIERFSVMDFIVNYLQTAVDVEVFSKNNIQSWLQINV